MISAELLRQAVDAARAGRRTEARDLFIQVVDSEPRNEIAWMWLTGLVDDLEDKIIACENVLAINPANEKVKAYLQRLLPQREVPKPEPLNSVGGTDAGYIPPVPKVAATPAPAVKKTDPLLHAELLEHEGKLDEALKAYEVLAARANNTQAFDHIYRQITRLEALKKENIQFVAPSSTVLRMTFTWPLLYLGFALMQMGLNPIANFSLLLWLGLPIVAAGSFLLALSEVRVRHVIWQKVFQEDGMGSGFARVALAAMGWVLVILPFALMLLGSLARLRNFEIPPHPFFG